MSTGQGRARNAVMFRLEARNWQAAAMCHARSGLGQSVQTGSVQISFLRVSALSRA